MRYILYNIKKKIIEEIDRLSVLDNIYYNINRIPNEEEIINYLKNEENNISIKNIIKEYGTNKIIKKIKEDISKIDNKVPLYDKYNENLYLVESDKVYNRVIYKHYRFPTKEIIDIIKKRNDLEKDKILRDRSKKKIILITNFLLNFDLDILYSTYVKIFYKSSNKDNTICYKPSFINYKWMTPFYTRTEIINLALNMGIIEPNETIYEGEELNKLCKKVIKNDLTGYVLKKHLEYIISQNKIGIVQYYSLQGSFFINQYLRELVIYSVKNFTLDSIIKSMWSLILEAPPFDKNYTIYRFIKNDDHLKNLEIGNLYITSSFLSTTRDPFYNSEEFKFGFILIRINIPKGVKGVGLCIETISQFSSEQEILLPPLSKLKLVKPKSRRVSHMSLVMV